MDDRVVDLDGLAFHYTGRQHGRNARTPVSAPEPGPLPEPPAAASDSSEEDNNDGSGDDSGVSTSPLEPGAVASLRKLLGVTKTAEGRQAAVDGGVASSCAGWLEAAGGDAGGPGTTRRGYEHLALLLRCLRNLCAGSPGTQHMLWRCRATSHALAIAVSAAQAAGYGDASRRAALGCAAMAVQFLGNSIAGNSALASDAWPLLYPGGFAALLAASLRLARETGERPSGPSLACSVVMVLQTALVKAPETDGLSRRRALAAEPEGRGILGQLTQLLLLGSDGGKTGGGKDEPLDPQAYDLICMVLRGHCAAGLLGETYDKFGGDASDEQGVWAKAMGLSSPLSSIFTATFAPPPQLQFLEAVCASIFNAALRNTGTSGKNTGAGNSSLLGLRRELAGFLLKQMLPGGLIEWVQLYDPSGVAATDSAGGQYADEAQGHPEQGQQQHQGEEEDDDDEETAWLRFQGGAAASNATVVDAVSLAAPGGGTSKDSLAQAQRPATAQAAAQRSTRIANLQAQAKVEAMSEGTATMKKTNAHFAQLFYGSHGDESKEGLQQGEETDGHEQTLGEEESQRANESQSSMREQTKVNQEPACDTQTASLPSSGSQDSDAVSTGGGSWLHETPAAQALWEDAPAMAALHLAVHMLGKLLIPLESSSEPAIDADDLEVLDEAGRSDLAKKAALLLRMTGPPPAAGSADPFSTSTAVSSGSVPRGLKTELLRLIGNTSYRHRASQDTVFAFGGVPAVLGLSMVDPSQPYSREWAVLALRNLMEDNTEIQAYVSAMTAQSVKAQGFADEQLAEMGCEVVLGAGGRPEVVKKQQHPIYH